MPQIPIDYRDRPWRAKYVDMEGLFAPWFEFGVSSDGTVDLASADGDVFLHVPRDVAERLLKARDAFCAAILKEIGG